MTGQGKYAKPIGMTSHHIQGIHPDAAGTAQNSKNLYTHYSKILYLCGSLFIEGRLKI